MKRQNDSVRPWGGLVFGAGMLLAALATGVSAQAEKKGADLTASPTNQPLAIYPYPAAGAAIGQGWDTFNDAATGAACVDVDVAQLERASYTSEVKQVISSLQLKRSQSASLSASYNGSGSSASGSASQSSRLEVNSDQQNFLFAFESSNGSTFAVPPGSLRLGASLLSDAALRAAAGNQGVATMLGRDLAVQPTQVRGNLIKLTDWAADMLRKNPAHFSRVCGQGFVSAIHRGARVHLLVTNTNAKSEEQRNFAAAVSASGYGASGKASYSQGTGKVAATATLSYRAVQEGGIPLKPATLSPETNGLLNLSSILPKPQDLIANPTAFRVVVTPYSNIHPEAAGKLPIPLDLITLDDYYVALSDLYEMVGNILNGAPYVANQAFTPLVIKLFGGEPKLAELRDAIMGDMAFLEGVIAECYVGRQACTVKGAVAKYREGLQKSETPTSQSAPSDWATSLRDAQNSLNKLGVGGGAAITPAALNAASAKAKIAQEDQEKAGLQQFRQEIDRFREFTDDDNISPEFFLRFYWYLTQIPIPDFGWTQPTLSVPPGSNEAAVAKLADDLREKLAQATLKLRIEPWKRFFCSELKSDVLCVDDRALRQLVMSNMVAVSSAEFTVLPPPSPPAQKRKRKCGSKYPGKCF